MSDSFFKYLMLARNDNSTDDIQECVSDINHYRFYQFSLIPAVILSILFAATKQRRQKFLNVLDGRPGLIHPMNTLTRSSRLSYCCAFGATAFLVYVILLEHRFAIDYQGPISLKSLIAVLSMFVYGMVFFPVFASLALATAFSYFLGSLYVWIFLVLDVYKLTECSFDSAATVILLIRAIPSLVCLGYLSLSLPIRFGLACWHHTFFTSTSDETPTFETLDDIKESYQGQHVRKLLKKPEKSIAAEGIWNKIKAALQNKIYEFYYHKQIGFRYPTRLVSVMFVAGCVVYVLTVELLVKFITLTRIIEPLVEQTLQDLGLDDDDDGDLDDEDRDSVPFSIQIAVQLAKILMGSWIAAIVTACLTTFINMMHMMTSFRTNLMAMYKGDFRNIPPPSAKSASSLCLGSMKFAGFQVAYIVWAYTISLLIIFIICLILSLIILVLLKGYTDWLVNEFLQIWPSILVAGGLVIIQKLLATYLFLQDRGKHLRLDNRRFFFIFTYFMFFYNIFYGLLSCLMRIIKAIIVGTLFLARLDNSTLPRKFESLDAGYQAYQGFIHMEAAHTHPVVLVFLRLLVSLSKSRKMENSGCVKVDMSAIDYSTPAPDVKEKLHEIESRQGKVVNIAARFNWQVSYTLLHNPQVRLYRKGFLQAMKKAVAEGRKIPISDKPITDFDLVKTQEEREQEKLEEVLKLQDSQPKKRIFANFKFGHTSAHKNSSSVNEPKGKLKKKYFWFGNKKKSAANEKVNERVELKDEEDKSKDVKQETKEVLETVIEIDSVSGAVNI